MTGGLSIVDIQTTCINMRIQGYSYQEIAEQTGVPLGQLHGFVKEALKEREAERSDRTEELRAIMTARNEATIRNLYEEVVAGNLYAIDRMIKLQDQIAALNGVKVERVDVTSGGQRIGLNAEDIAKLQAQAQAEIENWNRNTIPHIGAGSGSST